MLIMTAVELYFIRMTGISNTNSILKQLSKLCTCSSKVGKMPKLNGGHNSVKIHRILSKPFSGHLISSQNRMQKWHSPSLYTEISCSQSYLSAFKK